MVQVIPRSPSIQESLAGLLGAGATGAVSGLQESLQNFFEEQKASKQREQMSQILDQMPEGASISEKISLLAKAPGSPDMKKLLVQGFIEEEKLKEKQKNTNLISQLLGIRPEEATDRVDITDVGDDVAEVPNRTPELGEEEVLALTALNPSLGRVASDIRKTRSKEAIESYKMTEKYREGIANDYKDYEIMSARLNEMERLNDTGKLLQPAAKKLLDLLGLPIGVLNNPDSEEYDKLVADMTKNARNYYGARITNFELNAFLKTIPSLLNSEAGKRRIINNLRVLMEPAKLERNAYQEAMRDWRRQGKQGVPFDIRERVLERIQPQLETLADRFATGTLESEKEFTMQTLPKASEHSGRTVEDEKGNRYRSDGKSWRKVQ